MAVIQKDLDLIWHPCSQMKDFENFKPLLVKRAQGAYIELEDGRKIIDAISSWWCKSLGHQHPRLQAALKKQLDHFEHVIFANTTNETIVALSEKLTQLLPALNKVFYAGDGSCAVEIAMKMSLHARKITGDEKRTKFIALENSYHGETIGALSVSDVGIYRKPYEDLLLKTHFILNVPYINHKSDPLWENCSEKWSAIEATLLPLAEHTTAIIVEPILQGAGGMKIYSKDFLRCLRSFTKKHGIHLIADEIMTGIGRTGEMLAVNHAGITPDFLCLAKGLTAGWLPFSAVLLGNEIYDLFYDDYENNKSFLHSHTFSGHVLGASVALAVLAVIEEENLAIRAQEIGHDMYTKMIAIRDSTERLQNVRQIGALVAADLIADNADKKKRLGFEVFQKAVHLGAYLRPLGNTIYWLPPLNIPYETLDELAIITEKAIQLFY